MLLSIVMMVKNEEKNLERTLSALSIIRNTIDSELIILDTGSDDNTVEISKKYTDKVYCSKWNNNFADMRNKSISYAKGEWVLILDADEELINGAELIRFFESGKYKNYKSGSILLRNLTSNETLLKYNTALLLRLFKNDREFKYVGAIHEQPLYKEPIYEDAVGEFNHYGYLYGDEELKQRKTKRNEELLLMELDKKPNDPYVNYQVGKSYITSGEIELACKHLERSLKLYRKINLEPDYVYENLAKVYLMKNDSRLCKELCEEYIKKVHKNSIDIHYFLAKAQRHQGELEGSKKAYEKYLYLLENYQISRQSKSIYCEGSTINLRENAIIDIIKICYELKDYKEVICRCNKFVENDGENIEIYFILLNALHKTCKLGEIEKYYNTIYRTESDKNIFIMAIEKLMLTINKDDKKKLLQELEHLGGNYGKLNQIRIGHEKNIDTYKQILMAEKGSYYGDIVYQCFKDSQDILELLKELDVIYVQEYINYIVNYRRDVILELYKYLVEQPNTLDTSKMKVYKCIAKSLLFNGGLFGEKYERLFYLYKTYNYLLLKEMYNPQLSEEKLLEFITDSDNRFVLKVNTIEKLKESNRIEYIKKLKELLLEYPQHRKGIQILIDKFEEEIKVSDELRQLKVQYKTMIEDNINAGNLREATLMISEYENMFAKDAEILNMKFLIDLLNNEFDDLEMLLREALFLDTNSFNTMFNIGYLKEVLGANEEAIMFYTKIVTSCKDEEIVLEAKEKINFIKQNQNCLQGA